MVKRCGWAESHALETAYHDDEWGVPEHNDNTLFEMLCLEGAQSGLSWLTILKKREGYRRAFVNFEIPKVARYTEKKQAALLDDAGIVRHRLKINAVVENAKCILAIQKEYGSFDKFLWEFIGGQPIQNNFKTAKSVPAKTPLSDDLSKLLKKRGFKFIGSTTCYAFMQATGMVNDHITSCYRHKPLQKLR